MDIRWGTEEEKGTDKKPTADAPAPSALTVETIDNHIYFYSGVDSDRVLALIREVRNADSRLRNEHTTRQLGRMPLTPIWLHIQSGGGSLFAGFAAANQLVSIQSPVYTVIEGYCASAATLIALSGQKRYILPDAFMLIHQLSSFCWGKYDEFKDEMKLLEMAMTRLRTFYMAHSKLDEETVTRLLGRDSWFSPDECLDMGLVDAIGVE